MCRGVILTLALAGLLALTGCQACRQNDNLVHAAYDSPRYQRFLQWNDTHDVHALADTQFAKEWQQIDSFGFEDYYKLHQWLNSCERGPVCP